MHVVVALLTLIFGFAVGERVKAVAMGDVAIFGGQLIEVVIVEAVADLLEGKAPQIPRLVNPPSGIF